MKHRNALGLLILLSCPSIAFSQTMAVSVDPDRMAGNVPFVQVFDVTVGVSFDVVVWLDSAGSDGQAAELVVTDLVAVVPGVFRLGVVTIADPFDLAFAEPGEFTLDYRGCVPADGQLELVRVTYGDFSGVIGPDVLMTVRGFGPGDTKPSSFGGAPGFEDCGGAKFACEMGGTTGGVTGSGVEFPPGALVLNATPLVVPVLDGSIGQLKAKFD